MTVWIVFIGIVLAIPTSCQDFGSNTAAPQVSAGQPDPEGLSQNETPQESKIPNSLEMTRESWNQITLKLIDEIEVPQLGEELQSPQMPSAEEISSLFLRMTRVTDSAALAALNHQVDRFPNSLWFQQATEPLVGEESNKDCTLSGIKESAARLAGHLYSNQESFGQFVTAQKIMVNPCLAKSLGILETLPFAKPYSRNDFLPAKLSLEEGRTYPHSGILSDFGLLSRFQSVGANQNRSRSAFVYRELLGFDLNTLEVSAIDGEGPYNNPVMEQPTCVACHRLMDPVAGLFGQFGQRGSLQEFEVNPNMFSPGYKMIGAFEEKKSQRELTPIHHLGQKIALDPSFSSAITEFVLREHFGISLNEATDAERRREILSLSGAAKDHFVDNGLNLKALFEAILAHPARHSLSLGTWLSQPERAAPAEVRILAPEHYKARMESRTGLSFDTAESDWVNSSFHTALEGIDPESTSYPTRTPSALAMAAQTKTSLWFGCSLSVQELMQAPGTRSWFKRSNITQWAKTSLADWSSWVEDVAHIWVRLTNRQPTKQDILETHALLMDFQLLAAESENDSELFVPPPSQCLKTAGVSPSSWERESQNNRFLLESHTALTLLFSFILMDPSTISY